MLPITGIKRSRCRQTRAHREKYSCSISLFCGHSPSCIILAEHWACFMRWKKWGGGGEPNSSHWWECSAHTKVYTFQLRNNYSTSLAFVFFCALCCSDEQEGGVGPFITADGGGRGWICTPFNFGKFKKMPPTSPWLLLLLDVWLWVGGDLWFLIYDLWDFGQQTCPPTVNILLWND